MPVQAWFYSTEQEFRALYEQLKLTPCPHCHFIGALILHGFLRGYDENHHGRKAVRGRRVFCSNRNTRPGCGRTFSVWVADKIRRVGVSAGTLWRFLKHAASGVAKIQVIRSLKSQFSDNTFYRIWKRFERAQFHLRIFLASRCPQPDVTSALPACQTIAHLEAAFPDSPCPISSFQQTMRTFFM